MLVTESKELLEHTPLMQQYFDIKREHPNTLLLFQVGDFYELFFEDAQAAAPFLGIVLTTRGKNKGEPIPLCGVPMHAKDHYVTKLVKGGFRVALCDQLEPPRPGSVVKRGVTQLLTPGTLTDFALLDEKSASYLVSFFPTDNGWGLLFAELLTAQLFATIVPSGDERTLESELSRFFPDEILVPNTPETQKFSAYFRRCGYAITSVSCDTNDSIESSAFNSWMQNQFKDTIYKIVEKREALRLALTYFYAYLRRTNNSALNQFSTLQIYQTDDFLVLDTATQRNLEVVRNNRDGGTKHTLFSVVDRAVTPMGSRMIKKWLLRPLANRVAIEQRQTVVKLLVENSQMLRLLTHELKQVGDVERIVGRIGLNRAIIHDYRALLCALQRFPLIRTALAPLLICPLGTVIQGSIGCFAQLTQLLRAAINDDSTKEWVIREGFDQELDGLRILVHDTQNKLLELEREQREITGISSLKIRHTNAQGYYIEITKSNSNRVPSTYIRHQSLVGYERFIIPELTQLQQDIVSARLRIESVERLVFERVKQDVYGFVSGLRKAAHAIAHIDAFCSFAIVARDNSYVMPILSTEQTMSVVSGRHPVIEQYVDGRFIANDILFNDEHSFWIVTGPNMGGKSTFLRQVAHIALLTHCGSFVPAKSAQVPLFDRIFTRIGSGDSLAEGKSTFLVEMEETAAICTQATYRSLVILDEVGRGTSTFDGLAIAQAVVEYLHKKIRARALFATHYQELTSLESTMSGIVNYYAASKKTSSGILFLYQIMRGIADGSFGIEVAKLAGLPSLITDRARELIFLFTRDTPHLPGVSGACELSKQQESLGLIGLESQELLEVVKSLEVIKAERDRLKSLVQELEMVTLDTLSPRMAFDLIWRLKGQ